MIGAIDSGLLAAIVAALGGGGFLGGLVLLLKLRPEAGQITVTAAQGAVIVQTGVIEALRRENDRLQTRIDALEVTSASFSEMSKRVSDLENERVSLKVENDGLRERVQMLEASLAEVKRSGGGAT
jgi:threonine dehydratase